MDPNAPLPDDAATFPADTLPYLACGCGHPVSARSLRGLIEGVQAHVARAHPRDEVRAAINWRPIRPPEAPTTKTTRR